MNHLFRIKSEKNNESTAGNQIRWNEWILKYESIINENWIRVLEFKSHFQNETCPNKFLMKVEWIIWWKTFIGLKWQPNVSNRSLYGNDSNKPNCLEWVNELFCVNQVEVGKWNDGS